MVKIVADISGNHNGSLSEALTLIRAAALAGCDMVKFQLYLPDDMPDVDEGYNREMYERLHVRPFWLPSMFYEAELSGIPLFASVFAPWAVRELQKYDCPFIKLASPDSTKLPFNTEVDIVNAMSPGQRIISSGWREWLHCKYRLYCPPGHPRVGSVWLKAARFAATALSNIRRDRSYRHC